GRPDPTPRRPLDRGCVLRTRPPVRRAAEPGAAAVRAVLPAPRSAVRRLPGAVGRHARRVTPVSDESWAEQRRRAIHAHAAEQARRRAVEATEARALLAAFTRDALARGLRPTPLAARAYDGR